jgi:DNA-binding XRE family transcriptional regulator
MHARRADGISRVACDVWLGSAASPSALRPVSGRLMPIRRRQARSSAPVEVKSSEHVALGRAIHALRLDAGISQDEVARRAGMHRTYIGGIERGERNVSFANLLKIADALNERPSKLLARYERLL